jgi:hypothetical protein
MTGKRRMEPYASTGEGYLAAHDVLDLAPRRVRSTSRSSRAAVAWHALAIGNAGRACAPGRGGRHFLTRSCSVRAEPRPSPGDAADRLETGRNGAADGSVATDLRIPTAAGCTRSCRSRGLRARPPVRTGGRTESGPTGRTGSSESPWSLAPRDQDGRARPRSTCRQPPSHSMGIVTVQRGTASTRRSGVHALHIP